IDGVTHAVLKYLLVGQRVWHGAFTPDEKYLVVANGVSNDVSVIDVARLEVVKSIQVGELPWGVAFGPNGAPRWLQRRRPRSMSTTSAIPSAPDWRSMPSASASPPPPSRCCLGL